MSVLVQLRDLMMGNRELMDQNQTVDCYSCQRSAANLIKENDYRDYMCGKLIMEVELERQLTNVIHNERRGIQNCDQQHFDDAEQQRRQLSDFAGTN